MTSVVVTQTTINASVVQESVSVSVTSSPINVTISPVDINSHSVVTIGTANGLSLSGQVLSLGLSSALATGALSSTDWSTFNNKQNALGYTPVNIASADWIDLTDGGATVLHSHAGSGAVWGAITGTLSSQTDLQAALDAKEPTITILASTRGGTGVNNAGTITNASNTTITGGGTVALGGFTLTVPATGTAALLATANVFTTSQMVDMGADAIELRLQAHSTKTTSYLTTETSTGTVLTSIDSLGRIVSTPTIATATTIGLNVTSRMGASTGNNTAVSFLANTTAAGTTPNALIGVSGAATHGGSGNVVQLVGMQAGTNLNAVVTAGDAMAINANMNYTNTGTITRLFGLKVGIVTGGSSASIVVGTVTNAYGVYINPVTGATTGNFAILTHAGQISFLGDMSKASAAGAIWDAIELRAATATITGSTNITTATGFNYHSIARPTLSAASALTVTNSATLYIANSPLGGGAGPATITNSYAIWVDAGISQFDGTVNTNDVYQVDGTQVVTNRVIDARIDDVINSGDADTDGVIDAIRDALITHGLIAAA